jgi:hypothetical protein
MSAMEEFDISDLTSPSKAPSSVGSHAEGPPAGGAEISNMPSQKRGGGGRGRGRGRGAGHSVQGNAVDVAADDEETAGGLA